MHVMLGDKNSVHNANCILIFIYFKFMNALDAK